MLYLSKIPSLIHRLYPKFLWREKTDTKVIYLTFDDGPTPEITDWVMGQLANYNAKATFFVIGKNVRDYPEITTRIIEQGHTLGNHTQHHVNGKKVSLNAYLDDFFEAKKTLTAVTGQPTDLFRPPYGKISRKQAKAIMETHKVVMMDVLAGDFDPDLSPESCLQNVLGHARKGSVICLHDSKKAFPRLEFVLPRVLAHYHEKGFRFEAIRNVNTVM
ncbi:polysaccharide deacetylase family protein [bacterium]|nr:polysaccharide deacetylase family protein [bacterium]